MTSIFNDQPIKGTIRPLLPELAVSRNRLFNHFRQTITSYIDELDTLDGPTVVAPLKVPAPFFLTQAENLSITSSDIEDTALTGNGGWVLELIGLDNDWDPIREEVNLSGTTEVFTTQQFLRVNNASIRVAGPDGFNVGNIEIRNNSGSDVVAYISAGDSTDNSSVFSVGKGLTSFVYSLSFSVGRKTPANVDLSLRIINNTPELPYPLKRKIKFASNNASGSSYSATNFSMPIDITEYTDYYLEADTDTSNTEVVTVISLVIVDNEDRRLEPGLITTT